MIRIILQSIIRKTQVQASQTKIQGSAGNVLRDGYFFFATTWAYTFLFEFLFYDLSSTLMCRVKFLLQERQSSSEPTTRSGERRSAQHLTIWQKLTTPRSTQMSLIVARPTKNTISTSFRCLVQPSLTTKCLTRHLRACTTRSQPVVRMMRSSQRFFRRNGTCERLVRIYS